MAPEIQRLTSRFLKDPIKIEVARQNSVVETIDQKLVRVPNSPEDKRAALRQLIRGETALKNAIIFSNRKRDVATLARSLQRHGFSAGGLHGDMDQKSRMETLDAFKTGKLQLLIASDVAARGLDIPDVSHVFNFDVPTHAEDYIHRIGRTGRAGRLGTSITLATPSDGKYLDAIVRLIQHDIPAMKLEGGAADDEPAHEHREPRGDRPKRERQRGGRGRHEDANGHEAKIDRAPRPERAVPEADHAASDKPKQQDRAPKRHDTPKPQRERAPASGSNSPFGSDGPVPAFLLRPSGAR
jgi:superfamily II DNA/RNA helicase